MHEIFLDILNNSIKGVPSFSRWSTFLHHPNAYIYAIIAIHFYNIIYVYNLCVYIYMYIYITQLVILQLNNIRKNQLNCQADNMQTLFGPKQLINFIKQTEIFGRGALRSFSSDWFTKKDLKTTEIICEYTMSNKNLYYFFQCIRFKKPAILINWSKWVC